MGGSKICVIIPVKNEESGLKELLVSILSQKPAPEEVIVVDGGSQDGTLEIVDALARQEPRLKYILEPGALPGRGRNLGISSTNADIIVQVDGGCRVGDKWLMNLLDPILQEKADYVTGNIFPMKIHKLIFGERFDLGAVFFASMHRSMRGNNTIAGGASIAYKRKIWENVGGYPEWLRCGEDVLFVRKVKRLDVRHKFAHDSVAFWQIGPNPSDVYSRKVRYSRANALLDKDLKLIRRILARTLVGGSLVLLSFFWKPAVFVLIFAVLIFWGKNTFESVKRYFHRTERPKGRKLFVLFFLIAEIEIVLLVAEVVGLVQGFWERLMKKQNMEFLKQYNKKTEQSEM